MTTDVVAKRGPRGPYSKSGTRRQAIIEAAATVFAAQGYRGSSFQVIADRIQMSQTSLFHYFPTKGDLLIAVLHYRDSLSGGTATPPPSSGLVEDVLSQATYNVNVPGLIELYSVLSGEATTAGYPGREFFIDRFESLRSGYANDFRLLQKAGRLRAGVDPGIAAATLVALWDGIQTQWLLAPDAVDVVATLRAYFDLCLLPGPEKAPS